MKDIMLDLETLDTRQSAVVTSIGAVGFDPNSTALGARFYLELVEDTASQQEHGRTISGATVLWWMQQGAAAKQLFASPPPAGVERVSTAVALERFRLFVNAYGGKDARIWGNGADFDNVILGSLYESYGLQKPWSYSKNRCFRTMKNLDTGPRQPKNRDGVHHNALDDAVAQAMHLQEIFRCLRAP